MSEPEKITIVVDVSEERLRDLGCDYVADVMYRGLWKRSRWWYVKRWVRWYRISDALSPASTESEECYCAARAGEGHKVSDHA